MKNIKKINIFIPYFLPDKSYGGPITSIFSLSKFLSQFCKVSIYTTDLFYDSQQNICSKSVKKEKFTFFVKRSKNHFRNLLSSLLVLLKKKNEIIYINSFFYVYNSFPFFFLSRFALLNGNKLVISPRAELQPQKIKFKNYFLKTFFIFLYSFLASDKIIFISSSENEYEVNKRIFFRNKHIILPNLPRFNNFLPYKKSSNLLKIIFISRIDPIKGLHFFLESLLIYKKVLGIEIYIKGSISNNKYFEKINSMCKKLIKKGYKIDIEGHIDVTKEVLSGFDVMVLPTLGENFSHTIVEASQSGLFCLISNNTPWFQNTKGASEKLTYLSLNESISFVSAIDKLITLKQEKFSEYVKEQQNEIKDVLNNSFIEHKKFFNGL